MPNPAADIFADLARHDREAEERFDEQVSAGRSGTMPRMELIEAHAKERAGLPAEWEGYRWEVLPPNDRIYYAITGGVPRSAYTRGPRKGQKNFNTCDPATVRTVNLPIAEHVQWLAAWEQRTGNCAACIGTGQTVARISVTEGTTYRACGKCGGTGKSATLAAEVAARDERERPAGTGR